MRNILTSLSVIGIAATIAFGATMSYFSDTETSTGNSLAAGTLDLEIKNGTVWENGVIATWTEEDLKPGDISEMESVYLKNAGTIEADHLEITVENVVDDPVNEESDTEYPTDDMDKWIEIIEMYYNGTDVLGDLTDANGNGWKDLDDLESQGLDDLTPPPANGGGIKIFTAQFQFRTDADNDFQGDVVTSSFIFRLHQHPDQ